MTIGHLIAGEDWLENGMFRVWVPGSVSSVLPENLRYDLFNSRDEIVFGHNQILPELYRFRPALECQSSSLGDREHVLSRIWPTAAERQAVVVVLHQRSEGRDRAEYLRVRPGTRISAEPLATPARI